MKTLLNLKSQNYFNMTFQNLIIKFSFYAKRWYLEPLIIDAFLNTPRSFDYITDKTFKYFFISYLREFKHDKQLLIDALNHQIQLINNQRNPS